MQPLVTVYIPTHNRINLLLRALKTVLTQTYTRIEIIIVDDGSIDDTEKQLAPYINTQQIRYFKNHKAQGACYSRNLAIEHAQGDYITGLDDDDEFTPNRIEQFVQALNLFPSYAFYFTGYQLKDPNRIRTWSSASNIESHANILKRNRIGNQIFIEKTKLLAVDGFDISLPAWQDHDLWIRLSQKYGPAKKVDNTSYIVDRSHEHERISTNLQKIKAAHDFFEKKHTAYQSNRFKPFLRLNYLQYPGNSFSISEYLSLLFTPAGKRATKVFFEKQFFS